MDGCGKNTESIIEEQNHEKDEYCEQTELQARSYLRKTIYAYQSMCCCRIDHKFHAYNTASHDDAGITLARTSKGAEVRTVA